MKKPPSDPSGSPDCDDGVTAPLTFEPRRRLDGSQLGDALCGLPKSAFPRVPRRRMPLGAATIAKVRFFEKAAVRAQGS